MPFYELPVYRTQGPSTLYGRTSLCADQYGRLLDGATALVRSNHTQLNMIPDTLIIFCRRLNTNTTYADAYLAIANVSITFKITQD